MRPSRTIATMSVVRSTGGRRGDTPRGGMAGFLVMLDRAGARSGSCCLYPTAPQVDVRILREGGADVSPKAECRQERRQSARNDPCAMGWGPTGLLHDCPPVRRCVREGSCAHAQHQWPPSMGRRCFRAVDAMSEGSPTLLAINEEPNHHVVHAFRLGKTDRSAYHPRDPRAHGEVLALALLRLCL